MQKSMFKPSGEIRTLLGRADRVAVLSCTLCAALSGTGGPAGLRRTKSLLAGWGKTVAVARCVNACCSQAVMAHVVRSVLPSAGPPCDALLLLSCAAGVKAALLCDPGMPVVAALDTVGSAPVSRGDDLVARSPCVSCGACVISLTGGICPVSLCPSGNRYGPCRKAPEGGGACVLDPARVCVWGEIARRGDLGRLRELERIHRGGTRVRDVTPAAGPAAAGALRGLAGAALARMPRLSDLACLLR